MVSSKLEDVPVSDERRAVLDSASRALADLPTRTLAMLLPFLGNLRRRRCSTPTAAKFIDRWILISRYGELRQEPENRNTSDRHLLRQVQSESPTLTPQLGAVSLRSLQLWLKAYNDRCDDGLAGGLAALLRVSGRKPDPTSN